MYFQVQRQIGHVLDSAVNSVMSLADYHLYDVMVRVGL